MKLFIDQQRLLTVFGTSLLASALLAGCASPPPRPRGAVLPLEGGRYQSSVKDGDQASALKTFTRDAEITCMTGTPGRMPWDAQPPPGKYVVLSQSAKSKDGKEIKSDNKMLDAGIAVGLRRFGLESQDSIEVITIFRCA